MRLSEIFSYRVAHHFRDITKMMASEKRIERQI